MAEIKTILVVEDETDLQEAIHTKIEKEGMTAISAETAEIALEKLAEKRPDLIWLDLLMPGMGGFAFLEKLRATPEYQDIPVIIVSVSENAERIRRAFELHIVDYIIKSQFKLEDIVGRMKAFFASRSDGQPSV